MQTLCNPENKIRSAFRVVEANDSSNIRLNANGGNSILLVCEPCHEHEYIAKLREIIDTEKYAIIDLNTLLCKFIGDNLQQIEDSFEFLKGSLHQIFKAPAVEESPDLYSLILETIRTCLESSKIPVLIRAGALYGTGIGTIHLMENELVMRAQLPVIVLYPATHENGKLMFLGSRPASKYRCMVVE